MRKPLYILLGAVAVASLASPTLAQGGFRPAARPAARAVPQSRIMQQLGLTPLQKRQLNQMRRGRRDEQARVNNEIKLLRGQLAQMYRFYPLDERNAGMLIQQITALESQRLRLQLQNQLDLRRILTPEQFGRLNQLLQSSQRPTPGRPPHL